MCYMRRHDDVVMACVIMAKICDPFTFGLQFRRTFMCDLAHDTRVLVETQYSFHMLKFRVQRAQPTYCGVTAKIEPET